MGSVVATANGSFVAFDGGMAPIGRYDTLPSAKRSAVALARRPQDRPSRRLARGKVAACVIGAAAGGLALAAAVLSRLL